MGDGEDQTPFKLFVGQVPASYTAEQLRPNFEQFGNIEEVSIIYDKATQLSRGCGFVTFSTEDAARAAIEALSDKLVLNGKPLVVKFAEGLRQKMESKLYVTNIPLETSEEALLSMFAEHGEVKQVQLMQRAEDNSFKGSALVRFARRADAVAAAAALHNTTKMPGAQRPLHVKFAETRDSPTTTPSSVAPTGHMSPSAGAGHRSPSAGSGGHMSPVTGPYAAAAGMPPYVGLSHGMGGPDPYAMAAMNGMYGGTPAPPPAGEGFKLFVGMIPYSTGEAELQAVFSQFGPLMEVFMMREKDGRSKGCAFVRFYSREDATQACMQLNGSLMLPGAARNLVVKFAEASEPRHRGPAPSANSSVSIGGMRFGDAASMGALGAHGLPTPVGCVPHAAQPNAGGYMSSSSIGASDGGAWMMMQAGGGHGATHRPPMMVHSGQMPNVGAPPGMVGVGMSHTVALVPGGMGMSPMGMVAPYGMSTASMEAVGYNPSMYGGGGYSQQAPQYMSGPAAYQHQGMMEPPMARRAVHGWADGAMHAHRMMEAEYASMRAAVERGGGSALHATTPHAVQCGIGGPYCSGTASSMGSIGGRVMPVSLASMARMERQLSATTLSDYSDSPPAGQSWDRLYVSNLPRAFTEADVHRLFSQFGALAKVATQKRGDSASKGGSSFFVTFTSATNGQQAAKHLHNCALPGTTRPIMVRPSTASRRKPEPMSPRPATVSTDALADALVGKNVGDATGVSGGNEPAVKALDNATVTERPAECVSAPGPENVPPIDALPSSS